MATQNLRGTLACYQLASWRQPTALEASLRCSKPRPCKQQANALQLDGPVATVRNAGPMAVTPVGLLAIRWMGLWPSSAMVVALELLESNWLWMEARSTTTMIAICYCFPYCFAGTRHCSGVHAICRSSGCTCGLWKACGCNGLWPLVVESLWLQWPVAAGCGKP